MDKRKKKPKGQTNRRLFTNYQCKSKSYIDITIVLLQKTMKKTLFMYADIIFINER